MGGWRRVWRGPRATQPPLNPLHLPPWQLQKSKEREEQLEEMIQAYEKLCVEKAELETELGEMVGDSDTRAGDSGVTFPSPGQQLGPWGHHPWGCRAGGAGGVWPDWGV